MDIVSIFITLPAIDPLPGNKVQGVLLFYKLLGQFDDRISRDDWTKNVILINSLSIENIKAIILTHYLPHLSDTMEELIQK